MQLEPRLVTLTRLDLQRHNSRDIFLSPSLPKASSFITNTVIHCLSCSFVTIIEWVALFLEVIMALTVLPHRVLLDLKSNFFKIVSYLFRGAQHC